MEALKQRSVNYTPQLWEYYKHKGKLIFSKDSDGNKFPVMIHISEVQRTNFITPFTVFMDNPTRDFNPVLDLNEAEKLNNLGPAS